jgi:hypothetical protein
MAAVLVLLVVAFIALVRNLNQMLYGAPNKSIPSGESDRWALAVLGACLCLSVVLGLVLPPPLSRLLDSVVEIASP